MSEVHPPAEAIGTVIHWFDHLSVAAVRLTAPLAVVSDPHPGPYNRPGGDSHIRYRRAADELRPWWPS